MASNNKVIDEQGLIAALEAYRHGGYIVRTPNLPEPNFDQSQNIGGWQLAWSKDSAIEHTNGDWPSMPTTGYAYLSSSIETTLPLHDAVDVLSDCPDWVLQGYSQPPEECPDVDYKLLFAQQRVIEVNGIHHLQTVLVF